jgi:ElaB/YqjD/DUF883 family membrane-anchored ribosome-binding protein
MSNGDQPSREERIEQWLTQEGQRKKKAKKRREKIVPAVADAIGGGDIGQGLEVMGNLSHWFGDHPELPGAEVVIVSPADLDICFMGPEHPDLPEQFELVNPEANAFRITHQDAAELPTTGTRRGWQLEGVVPIGNFAEADESGISPRWMFNLPKIKFLGLTGVDGFAQGMLLGTAVEHVAAEWARDHHIWLCGFGEDAQRVRAASASYHSDDALHIVDSFTDITAEDVSSGAHTAYVKNASPRDLEHFRAIESGQFGLVSDEILEERAIYLSETYDGIADLLPDSTPVFPNMIMPDSPEYLVLESYYRDMLAAQKQFESITPEDFITDTTDEAPGDFDDAAIHQMMADYTAERADANTATANAPEASASEGTDSTASDDPEDVPVSSEQETADQPVDPPEYQLGLLGQIRVIDGDEQDSSQTAELLALLHTTDEDELSGVEVSQMIWPEDSPRGETARSRRKRLSAKVQDLAPDVVNLDGGWSLENEMLTDLSLLDQDQQAEHPTRAQTRVLLDLVETPLVGAGQWADESRDQIRQRVHDWLTSAEQAHPDLTDEIAQARNRLVQAPE